MAWPRSVLAGPRAFAWMPAWAVGMLFISFRKSKPVKPFMPVGIAPSSIAYSPAAAESPSAISQASFRCFAMAGKLV